MTELSTTNNLPQWLTEVINTENENLVKNLEKAFNISQEKIKAYRNNPSLFKNAYQYIQFHPAFWWRDEDSGDASWHTDCYTDQIWTETVANKVDEQGYSWALEAGKGVENAYTEHYHDLRLDVYANTLEEAYVKLARIISEVFKDDGTEKPNIEHLKSPLLKEAERRLAEYKESIARDDSKE